MVFAINTVVTFACSLGIGMGFNKQYHNENEKQIVAKHFHYHLTHQHQEHNPGSVALNHKKNDSGNGGCCNDKAIQFQQVDKSFRNTGNIIIKAPVFGVFMSALFGMQMKDASRVLLQAVIIPQHYPPPDIRIMIQSFQI